MRRPSRTFESFILLPLPGVVADRALGPNLGSERRFLKELVRDAPAGIAPAAGRHHITNFDAASASAAARGLRLQFQRTPLARMIRNSVVSARVIHCQSRAQKQQRITPHTVAENKTQPAVWL